MYMNGIKNKHYDFYFVSKMLNRDGTFLNLVLLWSFLNFNQVKDILKKHTLLRIQGRVGHNGPPIPLFLEQSSR